MPVRDFLIQHWQIGDEVVTDFPFEINARHDRKTGKVGFVPWCCALLGLRTGMKGRVVAIRRNRFKRISYEVDFGFVRHVLFVENLKSPGEKFQEPRRYLR